MTCGDGRDSRGDAGFTLFEALVAVALTGLVLAMLGTVTARWLPSWNFGFKRLQQADIVGLALERIVADLAAAEFLSLDRQSQRASFDGGPTSVIFIRSSLGPNAVEGLEIIRLAEEDDGDGTALVRSRAPFTLLGPEGDAQSGIVFADRIKLLRAPLRVSFSYADEGGRWRETWRKVPVLPSAIRITVEDSGSDRSPLFSTVASPRVSAAAVCAGANSPWGCVEELARNGEVRIDADPRDSRR